MSPRPTQGFSTQRAQQWVLACAMITALIYAFRRIVEPTTGTGKKSSSSAAQLAGAGSPPSLERWSIAFGAAFLILSVLSMGAPELAASLALMGTLGNFLTNGLTIASDITGLEGGTTTSTTGAAAAATVPATAAQNRAAPAVIDGASSITGDASGLISGGL